jgi:predicted outer membrane protein
MRMHRLLIAASTAFAASVVTSEAARGQVVTAAGGEVTKFTQKNIVDRLIVDDSLEVEMARFAAGQTKNAAVREFANLLVTDNGAHIDALRKLADVPDIGRMAPSGDSSSAKDARRFAQMRAMPADSTFDRAFVTDQVQRLQRASDNLKKWRAAATSPVLQADIDRALPVVEAHLARAQSLAAQFK